jgi:carbon starvation protein
VLFRSHQFASIAGAGPINGPIQAAVFGWAPVFIWIIFGGIFCGAVQDFAVMYTSVRHKGRTIGYIIEAYIGKTGKKLFLLFCWLFCILIVAAFADIVAYTFDGFAENGELVTANGSVATTSLVFIAFAVVLGLTLKKIRFHKWVNTAIAIVRLVGAIAIGLACPVFASAKNWHFVIFAYVFAASVVPIWALLVPRDYLNSYLMVAMIIAAVVGIFATNPSINLPAITNFNMGGAGLMQMNTMFPFLFVTIACGAISGFHSLVSSGTTSKQIKNEKDMLPVSFGAMLLESLLAVISLIAVASFATGEAERQGFFTPPQVFAGGIANCLIRLGLPSNVVFTLVNLSVSAFTLTTLDSVARIGRISFQELFMDDSKDEDEQAVITRLLTNKYFATTATLLIAYFLAKSGYMALWPLFGSSNQLLAVLALLACAVFLKKTKRFHLGLVIPAMCMTAVTFVALVIKILQLVNTLSDPGNILQLIFAVLVFGLGISIVYQGFSTLAQKKASAAY